LEGTLRVDEHRLTVDCPALGPRQTTDLAFVGGFQQLESRENQDRWPSREWSLRRNHILGKLQGTLIYQANENAQAEAYAITGAPEKQ
jgi:hypothetical protein